MVSRFWARWLGLLGMAVAIGGCPEEPSDGVKPPAVVDAATDADADDSSAVDAPDVPPVPECTADSECDDTDPCNGEETCGADGACVAGTPVEGCCASHADCDDGLACNGIETCDLTVGTCSGGAALPCDDGNACNGPEACLEGVGCAAGEPLQCDDGDACNGVESCDPASGCVDGEPLECDDGDLCNGPEACDADSGCVDGAAMVCDDGDACNGAETCDPPTGCVPGEALICDDADACNGAEACEPALGCVPGEALTCDDGDACNGVETCDAQAGCLTGIAVECDDGKACNGVETCDALLGCVPGGPPLCDDGDACNGLEVCDDAGGCAAGQALVCDDGDACNGVETCESASGCVDGEALACDDGDACNGVETCDTDAGCQSAAALSCDDGLPCNGVETCDAGAGCVAGAPPLGCCSLDAECDDDKACNGVETCDTASATCALGAALACDDGDACNGVEVCDDAAGGCAPGAALECDDDNPCTDDACATATGCTHTANTSPCDDDNVCSHGDSCAGGACLPGPPHVCDDGDPCNGVEACSPGAPGAGAGGCAPGTPLQCNDGNPCNGLETCKAGGGCQSGQPLVCGDNEPCTVDSCDPAEGCLHEPSVDPCSDGDACTAPDVCAGGSCASGPQSDCDDSDTCTIDSCDAATGCVHLQEGEPATVGIDGVPLSGATSSAVLPVVTVVGGAGEPAVYLLDGGVWEPGTPITGVGSHTLTVTVTDCAGAVHTTTASWVIDPEPPTLEATVAPKPNDAGWNNLPTTVTWSASDSGGGELVVSEPTVVDTPGASIEVTGSATDAAGNTTTLDVVLNLDFKSPAVAITAPVVNQEQNHQFVTGADSVVFAGTLGDDALSGFHRGLVTSSKLDTEIELEAPGPFEVTIPLIAGVNTVIVSAQDVAGNTGTASVCVIRDAQPPLVAIQYPKDGAQISTDTVTVSGLAYDLVVGAINDEDVSVTVNGIEATVSNGHFLVEAVPLAPGENTLEATATDAVGHVSIASIVIERAAAGGTTLEIVSGDHQLGLVASPVSAPLVVRLASEDGEPVVGHQVLFAITDNDGTLGHPAALAVGPSQREVLVETDDQGLAEANFTLGTSAGAGENRVTVTAPGVFGSVSFFASGEALEAIDLYPHAGLNQIGTTGQPFSMPLGVLVTDKEQNPVGGVPVSFEVTRGDGKFPGGLTATVLSNAKGFADVVFTPGQIAGLATHEVVASIPTGAESVTEQGVTFTLSAYPPKNPYFTTVTGVVVDDEQQPIEGVEITFPDIDPDERALTDADGRFYFAGAPSGYALMKVDGTTGVPPLSGISYPEMIMEVNLVEGADNTLDRPVYLPRLNQGVFVDGSEYVEIGLEEVPGFRLTIQSGTTVTFPDETNAGMISVTQVNFDQAPMPPVNGLQSRVLVTIQPPGVHFDPPAPLQIPNTEGYPPGRKVEMYSFDHDIEAFVPIGAGSVSSDGTVIRTDPGVGVVKGGWHCGTNPQGSGQSANVTASLSAGGGSKSSIELIGTGSPGPGTTWGFCSSGTIAVTPEGDCAGKTECKATATPTGEDGTGFGKVTVVHECPASGARATDTKVVTICDASAIKEKREVNFGGDAFKKAVDLVQGVLTPFCGKDAVEGTFSFNAEEEIYDTCCLGCGGKKVTNRNLFAAGKAVLSFECPTPWAITIDLWVVKFEAGVFIFGEMNGKAGLIVNTDMCCADPPCRDYQGGISVELKGGVRLKLLEIKDVVSLKADGFTGVGGNLTLSDSGELCGQICWSGIVLEVAAELAGGMWAWKAEYVIVCPQEIWSGAWQLGGAPSGEPNGGGCGTAPPDPGEPECGAGGSGGDPNGEQGNTGTCGSSNTGFVGGCGTCPGVTGGSNPPCASHADCSDNNLCNGSELCNPSSGCEPGTPPECTDDDVECTTSTCDPAVGCVQVADDSECYDGVGCTTDSCHPTNGCVHTKDSSYCNDDVPCTSDACTDSGCSWEENDAACNDGLACTTDTCVAYLGCSHAPEDSLCNDGVDCTLDACEPGVGCTFTPQHDDCEDGFDCTADACTPSAGGCTNAPVQEQCADDVACTVDVCDPDAGCQHNEDDEACNDGVGCTTDACSTLEGCTHESQDGDCSDGVDCTEDRCDQVLGCQSAVLPGACNDGVACTADTCDTSEGCLHAPDNALCDDGSSCTADSCTASGCVSLSDDSACDDGVACTTDTCQGTSGCVSAPDHAACNDGVGCTTDLCGPGGCSSTADHASCADGVDCTADSCSPTLGCVNAPNHGVCGDGTACTLDRCRTNAGCVAIPRPAQCDDGKPCTADACVSGTGCTHTPEPGCLGPATCSACAVDCLHCGRVYCDAGVRRQWVFDAASGGCTEQALPGCPDGEIGEPVCADSGALLGYTCAADACVPMETPCGGGTASCLQPDGAPAQCVACCVAADCNNDGQPVCASSSISAQICVAGACAATSPPCPAAGAGPLGCSGGKAAWFTCGSAGCSEVVEDDCAGAGQACDSGQCVGGPP